MELPAKQNLLHLPNMIFNLVSTLKIGRGQLIIFQPKSATMGPGMAGTDHYLKKPYILNTPTFHAAKGRLLHASFI